MGAIGTGIAAGVGVAGYATKKFIDGKSPEQQTEEERKLKKGLY